MTDEPTRNDNILDLVMTTNQDLVNDLQIEPEMSDHEIVIAYINIGAQRVDRNEQSVFRWLIKVVTRGQKNRAQNQ
jgi:putative NADH-flavin reductase